MSRLTLVAIAVAAMIASTHCAGGGPSGTHFATAQGNLVNAEASPAVQGVRVSVEGTPFENVTDATGSFVVRGDFAGAVTLLFERDDDGLVARIAIEVPEGGTVTLRNVSCSNSSGQCAAEDIDVDEPSDDDVSEPSVEDPSDPSVPSPAEEEIAEQVADVSNEGSESIEEPTDGADEERNEGPGGEDADDSEDSDEPSGG